jgi:excisionase family DNA binding protein
MAINSYLLRSRDVAHLLDIAPDEVSELALRKELKAEKVGRLWRYKIEDVMAYRRRRERENG